MEICDVIPTPPNYQLWVAYLSGEDADLQTDMDAALAEDGAFTQALAEELYEKHFGASATNQTLQDAGGRLADEIAKALGTLQTVGRNTKAFGQTLEGASGRLTEDIDQESLQTLLSGLALATNEMRKHNDAMDRRLRDTTREVVQLRANLQKARQESLTDILTGVANRKAFNEAYAAAFKRCSQQKKPLSLLLADIDHFKKFNDTWGHQVGDQVIRFVATCLDDISLDGHVAARYGGEEFAVIMPNTGLGEAAMLAEQMRRTVASRKLIRRSSEQELGKITISLGVSGLRPGDDEQSLLERADELLYESKGNGRDQVTCQSITEAAA
ncbi:MAG: GGDEF domain-containing protein [Caulobacterales bacterium]|nr:GGDEF domain-containing protein [Caulobacterales bacterium]